MGKKRKDQLKLGRAKPSTPPVSLKRRPLFLIAALATVTALAITLGISRLVRTVPSSPATTTTAKSSQTTLGDLLTMTPGQLESVDIALMNLLCAQGLPGAEELEIGEYLASLEKYAERVRNWTDQSLYDFRQRPQEFRNSEAFFRVLLLISVLQKDFGIHYNDRGERNVDFSNSKNVFIHGMIDDNNGGTCASMPVLYVAVGRRLGYPMKLVLAKTHIFARWESPDGKERFNIEGTRDRFSDHPDSYYRNWPYPISDTELENGWYLKSLRPIDELAVFLQNRAHCLLDNGRISEAQIAFAWAHHLAPHDPLGIMRLVDAVNMEATRMTPQGLAVFENGEAAWVDQNRTRRRRDPIWDDDIWFKPARDPMADLRRIEAINEYNRQLREQQMRLPSPYGPRPTHPSMPSHP